MTAALSQARGKMGSIVFSVKNGTQIMRAYQPVVANPRTIGQRLQRAKMNLAGKISSCTPARVIEYLPGGSVNGRRAKYLKNLMNSIVAAVVEGVEEASLANSQLLFSEGTRRTTPIRTAMTITRDAENSTMTITPSWIVEGSEDNNGFFIKIVCGYFVNDTPVGGFEIFDIKPQSVTTYGATTIPLHVPSAAGIMKVWVIPCWEAENASGINNSWISDDNNGINASSNPVSKTGIITGQSYFYDNYTIA